MREGAFLDQLSDYQLLNKDSDPWSFTISQEILTLFNKDISSSNVLYHRVMWAGDYEY
jgi:hypothetical protein